MTPPPEKFLFVAGASGNTGSRAVARLAAEGWCVKCLSRTAEREQFIGRGERIEIVRGDLKEIDSLIEHVRGAAAFLNLAHIGFGAEAVEACRRSGVARLISLSSTRRFTKFADPTAERVIAATSPRVLREPRRYRRLCPLVSVGSSRESRSAAPV